MFSTLVVWLRLSLIKYRATTSKSSSCWVFLTSKRKFFGIKYHESTIGIHQERHPKFDVLLCSSKVLLCSKNPLQEGVCSSRHALNHYFWACDKAKKKWHKIKQSARNAKLIQLLPGNCIMRSIVEEYAHLMVDFLLIRVQAVILFLTIFLETVIWFTVLLGVSKEINQM